MRPLTKLATTLAAATVALGFSTTLGSAQVVVGDVDVITFQANAILTPGIALTGGTSTFSFTTSNSLLPPPLPCMAASADSDIRVVSAEADADVAPCSITATGTYTNIFCGTGTAGGTATLTEGGDGVGGPKTPSDVYDASFSIQFVAGIGVVTGVATEQGDASESSEVVGVVLALPLAGNCVTTPITSLAITGVLATTV